MGVPGEKPKKIVRSVRRNTPKLVFHLLDANDSVFEIQIYTACIRCINLDFENRIVYTFGATIDVASVDLSPFASIVDSGYH